MSQAIRTEPAPRPPVRMSYEEFLKTDFGSQRVEWVDGGLSFMGTVSREHSLLVKFLLRILADFIEINGLGELFFEPFNMRLPLAGRNPDLLFVARDHLDRIQHNFVAGPADLVVEVVSPDDPDRDRVEKFREYEQGGVREYWILDPQTRQADFYLLDEAGRYLPMPLDVDGVFRSAALDGLWLHVDWLWQEPLPPVMQVLKEWGLV